MTVTKVLIDGGAGLNIIFSETLRKMGLEFTEIITPTSVPFYGIVPARQPCHLDRSLYRLLLGLPQTTV
jgi:hypothetical protein